MSSLSNFSNLFPICQVGNKADLSDRREVEFEVAAEFASENNVAYIETSVMNRSNIEEAFVELVKNQ